MSGCEVFEITLTRGYDETMFREDLKQLYTLLGSDNKKVRMSILHLHSAFTPLRASCSATCHQGTACRACGMLLVERWGLHESWLPTQSRKWW